MNSPIPYRIQALIESIETEKIPLHYFILSLLALITLREFIEVVSAHNHFDFFSFVSFGLFYLGLALPLICLLSTTHRVSLAKVSRSVLAGFAIIILPPIADLVLSHGEGFQMGYLSPEGNGSLLSLFVTFFGEWGMPGISPGIRIELIIVLFSSGVYGWIKTQRMSRSLFSIFFTYVVVFFYLSIPYYIDALFGRGSLPVDHFQADLSSILVLISSPFLWWLIWKVDPKTTRAVISDGRYPRYAYYWLMLLCGTAFGGAASVMRSTTPDRLVFVLGIFNASLALLFAWLFSVITNNIADQKIDQISNKTRPLAVRSVDIVAYQKAAWVSLALALLHAALTGFVVFMCIAVFIGSYFLYSMPPFRFKRVFLLSKLAIGLNSFVMALAGYALSTNSSSVTRDLILDSFTVRVSVALIIGITIAANFIDLKDTEGDKSDHIKTLPVLIGQRQAQFVVAASLMFVFALLPQSFSNSFPKWPFYAIGVIQFFLIVRRRYDERPVLLLVLCAQTVALYSLLR